MSKVSARPRHARRPAEDHDRRQAVRDPLARRAAGADQPHARVEGQADGSADEPGELTEDEQAELTSAFARSATRSWSRSRPRSATSWRTAAHRGDRGFFNAAADQQGGHGSSVAEEPASGDLGPDRARGVDWGETVARLQRFYGGPPGWWLAEAPIALVRALSAMLPRLQAEERLNAITDGASLPARWSGASRADVLSALRKTRDRAAGRPRRTWRRSPRWASP
jgi:hypothetical protein